MHRLLASVVAHTTPIALRRTAVLVATRAGAAQLRTTLERLVLEDAEGAPAALVLPDIVTREQWYRLLHERLRSASPWLNELEREVIFGAAAEEATSRGCPPPFELRAGLVAEILGFYDDLHRNLKDVDRFERLLVEELEPSSQVDRGAERLLRQTRFLVAAFRAYRRRLDEADLLDESRCRERLLSTRLRPAVERMIVTVPDSIADAASGLWPADFDLLSRLHDLTSVDIVATGGVLDAGFRERLENQLPGAEDVRWPDADCDEPTLAEAAPDRTVLTARDREEELVSFARAVKGDAGPPDEAGRRAVSGRVALVFQRPLPYLYLAGPALGGAGIPYQTVDAMPLAAEPYAASIELVFDCVDSAFAAPSVLRLLRDPNFSFVVDGAPVERHEVSALRHALGPRLAGHLSQGLEALAARPSGTLPAGAARAIRAARMICDGLAGLAGQAPASTLAERLLAFLELHDGERSADEAVEARQQAVRVSILGAIRALRDAHRRFGDPTCELAGVAARLRRWIEAQTFAPRRGRAGVHLVDARTARYGDFDTVRLVGLVEEEWPVRPRRNIFYPLGLLARLGWAGDADRVAAGRAEFIDLLRLPRRAVSLSVFTLDEDRLVGPSPLLDQLEGVNLAVAPFVERAQGRVSVEEALSIEPVVPDVVSRIGAEWLAVRRGRTSRQAAQFHGQSLPSPSNAHSVTSVERYLDCPFQYFAQRVLRIAVEPDEDALAALERGRFMHELFRAFFDSWQAAGQSSITPETVGAARRLFDRVARQLLERLPEADREIERRRVLGSALSPGAGERVFQMELERPGRVVERLLEFRLDGRWNLGTDEAAQQAEVRGVADRIDLLADGTLWLLDYKTGRPPSRSRAVQLPVYAACAEQRLRGHRGRDWRAAAAGYVALGERHAYVPLGSRPSDMVERLVEGRRRFLAAVAQIEEGRFPPSPAEITLCATCAYDSVCRKEYVGDV